MTEKFEKGRSYDYVCRDGKKYSITFLYAEVNLYVFKIDGGAGRLFVSHCLAKERIKNRTIR